MFRSGYCDPPTLFKNHMCWPAPHCKKNTALYTKTCLERQSCVMKHLYAHLPHSAVHLVSVEPSHVSFAVSNVVKPHSLVNISRRIAARAPTMLPVLRPITFVEGNPFTVIIHATLKQHEIKTYFSSNIYRPAFSHLPMSLPHTPLSSVA